MNWQTWFDQNVTSSLCLALVHSIWQVALLSATASAIDRLLGRQSVERSYALQVGALVLSLAALPVTYAVVKASAGAAIVATHASTGADAAPVESTTAGSGATSPAAVATNSATLSAAVSSLAISPETSAPLQRLANYSPWLAALYGAGVIVMSLRLARGVVAGERLRRRAAPVEDGSIRELLERLAARWSLGRAPALATVAGLATPKVIGLVKPTILLPAATLAGMPASELELILVHELAHIRRHDLWINLVQRVAEVVLFFNPSLWYLSRRIGTLREYCCDEFTCRESAASAGGTRVNYAQALVRVVELSHPTSRNFGELAALAAAGRGPSELRRRVSRLLGEPIREPAPLTRGGAAMLAALVLAVTIGPAVYRPSGARADGQPREEKPAPGEFKNTVAERFSFGSEVEVLALGEHGEGEQAWWDPKGESIERAPFAWKSKSTVSAEVSAWRRIVFRVKDMPEGADIRWDIVGASATGGGEITLDGKERTENYYTRYFGVRDKADHVDLRVGIAHGPWRTMVTTEGSPLATGMRETSIVFSEALETPQGTVVVVSHNSKQNYRVIAVDREGKTHNSVYTGGMSAGEISQTRPTFPRLKPRDVERFEFQVRDFDYVEIKELPINPTKGGGERPKGGERP